MIGPAAIPSHEAQTARLIDELRQPAAYAHPVDEVGFLQTHISLLFFAGERVYKIKKPVDLGFLDFRSLNQRLHFCREEVRLNRRLSPEVYLGVCPITRSPHGEDGKRSKLRFGGEGEIVEWAVEMVRLPAARMFDNLLDRGEIDNAQMNAVAALLAGFHASAATGPGVDEHGSMEAIRGNVEENFAQLLPFVRSADEGSSGLLSGRLLRFLQDQARAYLAEHADLFERRVKEGRIRDGHGDLHAGNICFQDEILIYDCIEFSPRLRCGDVAADIAFLAMDLDNRSYKAFSAYLVKRYAQEAGDGELAFLMGFYKAYRAIVRGKVLALTSANPALGEEERLSLRGASRRYLHLAAGYDLPPALILMCGLPASGKSWLARQLVTPLRATHLRSDVRRKVSSGLSPTTRTREVHGTGLYSEESKAATYRSLLASAREALSNGRSVIVDATFSKRDSRSLFVDAAERAGHPVYVLHVVASAAETAARLEARSRDASEPSDADAAVYERELAAFQPPDEIAEGHLCHVVSGERSPERHCALLIDRMIENEHTIR